MAATGAELLALALSVPAQAYVDACSVLAAPGDEIEASYAHQAIGIVLRDRGDMPAALSHLRAALAALKARDRRDRVADVRASLGATLVLAGRTRAGLAELAAAAEGSEGVLRAQILMRSSFVLQTIGRSREALADATEALAVTRRAQDRLWQARILLHRSHVLASIGELPRARSDATAAQSLFTEIGDRLGAATALHNLADFEARAGNLPVGLQLLERAAERYRALDFVDPDLFIDRGRALLAAGLAVEAMSQAQAALDAFAEPPAKRAELLVFAARAALAANRLDAAVESSLAATRLFHRQERPSWAARAQLLTAQARYRGGDRSARLLTGLAGLSSELSDLRAEEAPLAHLLAGQLAAERGRRELAVAHLSIAGKHRQRGSPLARSTGWLAHATQASTTGAGRELLHACRRGLDALDEHRLVFGAAELRAVATTHGRDLSALALEHVTTHGSPRGLLEWSERWRATSLADPSVRSSDDAELEGELAALRAANRRIDETGIDDAPASLVAQRDRWESAVRRRRLHLAGSFGVPSRFDVGELLDALGERQLVSLVEVGGQLHAVLVAHARVRRFVVGSADEAAREVEFARFGLRRAAHARSTRPPRPNRRLQQALLGPVADRLSDCPVVIVAPATLHAAPWAQLPALAGRPVSVSPSAQMWLRAHVASGRIGPSGEALVVGPGLGSAGGEVDELARLYADARVLGDDSPVRRPATVDDVLVAMDGTRIAHVAAHGRFRADSPLFSSLVMDDGPLFVHDLDRLQRAPQRVVLSACDSGVATSVGADELLGLVSGLLRVGTAGVLASVVPVNDEAAVPFMIAVHQALATGADLAAAALAGRRQAGDDPLAVATASSFTVWGA